MVHRYLWDQLRHRGARTLALLLGILVQPRSSITALGRSRGLPSR